MKKKLVVLLLTGAMAISLVACGGSEEKKEDAAVENVQEEDDQEVDANGWTKDDKVTFMTITQSLSDEFLSDYKSPWGLEDWTFAKFDDEGKIVVTTKYTLKDSSEKQPVMCIFTYDAEQQGYKGHFLLVGEKVYLDDGSCDEILEKLMQLSE